MLESRSQSSNAFAVCELSQPQRLETVVVLQPLQRWAKNVSCTGSGVSGCSTSLNAWPLDQNLLLWASWGCDDAGNTALSDCSDILGTWKGLTSV